jgi:hypothetical protein
MPSIYMSDAELAAVQLCAAQLNDSLASLAVPAERETAVAQLAILRGIERKCHHAQSARQLKKALRQRYR